MPIEARLESGLLGFSVNFATESSSFLVMMPKREASAQSTGMTEMVRSALLAMWLSTILL